VGTGKKVEKQVRTKNVFPSCLVGFFLRGDRWGSQGGSPGSGKGGNTLTNGLKSKERLARGESGVGGDSPSECRIFGTNREIKSWKPRKGCNGTPRGRKSGEKTFAEGEKALSG